MTHAYCTIDDVKDSINDSGSSLDAFLVKVVLSVTEFIDKRTKTQFVPWSGEKRFDGSGTPRLFIPDCLSLTTVVDDTSTLTDSDYLLYPRNAASIGQPYTWLQMDPDGTYSSWTREMDIVSLTGAWGYSQELESLTTLAAAIESTTATTITVPTGLVQAGHVLKIGDEALFVSAVTVGDPSDTVTVKRGQEGTTAATHENGATVSNYEAPYDIWQVAWGMAKNLYKAKDQLGERATALEELGKIQINRALTKDLAELLKFYMVRRRVRIC